MMTLGQPPQAQCCNITNLGAILLARDVTAFPSISGKATRIIKYAGRDKSRSEFEQEGRRGYAVGFTGMRSS
jgi:predicted HTH transcriptional regulator